MFDERMLFERLRSSLPATAVMQTNPHWRQPDIALGLYARRQIAAGGDSCGTELGGDPGACAVIYPVIRSLFDVSVSDPKSAFAICRDYSIEALVITDMDAVWQNRDGWIWKRKPEVETQHARAFLCRDLAGAGLPK